MVLTRRVIIPSRKKKEKRKKRDTSFFSFSKRLAIRKKRSSEKKVQMRNEQMEVLLSDDKHVIRLPGVHSCSCKEKRWSSNLNGKLFYNLFVYSFIHL